MSTAEPLLTHGSDIDTTLRRNVKILTAAQDVRRSDLYEALGMSRQVWSSRLTGVTKFTVPEVVTISRMLGVTVEELVGPTAQLLANQNWKVLNASDLLAPEHDDPSDDDTCGLVLYFPTRPVSHDA